MNELAVQLIEEAYENKSALLDLGNCGLEEIPKEILLVKDTLKHLNLGDWYFKGNVFNRSVNNAGKNRFYDNRQSLLLLNELPLLESLYVNDCGLGETGAQYLSTLSSITSLGISGNEIGNQGAEYLSRLLSLTWLDVGNNNINWNGAKFIGRLSSLNTLHISENHIDDGGVEFISRLSSLTSLAASECSIGYKGAGYISYLTSLDSLELGGNEIGDIGANYISKISSLASLNLSGNGIKDMGAKYISQLSNLTALRMTYNEITEAGARQLARLSKLTSLRLDSNAIGDKGAEALSELSSLTSLSLTRSQIGDDGAVHLSRLSRLSSLSLSYNMIKDRGAEAISRLPLLTELHLDYNRINKFDFVTSPVLHALNLMGNHITELSLALILKVPGEFVLEKESIPKPGNIYLFGNAIKNIPPEVLTKGRNAAIEYLGGELKPLNECKLIFVGDGSAGKTSLMKRLVYGAFDSGEITTHGINKIAWKGIINEDGEPIKINCWDFGGQHIQHSLHQFFFTERVVYVLVLNPRNDEKAGYWLDQIDKLGCNSQIIIVFNWKNEKDIQADYLRNFRELKKTYKYLPEPIVLSCATGDGIPAFTAALKTAILANDGLKTKYPKPWFNIKEKLETRIPIEKHYIEYAQYESLCAEESYNIPEQRRNLLRILDSVGAIVFFDKPVLNELQVLNPEWITTGAYAILTSEITNKKRGHLTWDDLCLIFSAEKEIFSDKKIRIRYEEPQFKFILQLMLDYWLCQENPLVKHEYLVPVAFGEKPDKGYDLTGGRHYRLKFQSPFEMLIIHRFIAKNILNIVSNDYWNSGIYFKHASSETFSLVETNQYSRVIDCWIKGENIAGMWEVIRNDFREIFNLYHNFQVDEEVEYTQGDKTVFFNYEEMLGACRNGIAIIQYDPKTGLKDIEVLKVLELFAASFNDWQIINKELIKVEVNPKITVNPQFINNPVFNNNLASPEQKKEQHEAKVYALETENVKVKKWKNRSVISLVSSLVITIFLVVLWINKLMLDANGWNKLEDLGIIKWVGLALGLIWNGFIAKSIYDRFYDPSKEKAYRESLRK